MPPRVWHFRLEDIVQAVEKILRYTDGMTFEQFLADDRTVDAVVRNLTVIGEAARHIPDDFTAGHPEIPWKEMRGIRNVVVHEYFGVSKTIVWETTKRDLPVLLPSLRGVLERLSTEEQVENGAD